jgi:hypothetical protein
MVRGVRGSANLQPFGDGGAVGQSSGAIRHAQFDNGVVVTVLSDARVPIDFVGGAANKKNKGR